MAFTSLKNTSYFSTPKKVVLADKAKANFSKSKTLKDKEELNYSFSLLTPD